MPLAKKRSEADGAVYHFSRFSAGATPILEPDTEGEERLVAYGAPELVVQMDAKTQRVLQGDDRAKAKKHMLTREFVLTLTERDRG